MRVTYSSLRTLFPPNASPELQSSRLANTFTLPPRAADIRGRGWIGEGPKRKDSRGMLAKGWGSSGSDILNAMLVFDFLYTFEDRL